MNDNMNKCLKIEQESRDWVFHFTVKMWDLQETDYEKLF